MTTDDKVELKPTDNEQTTENTSETEVKIEPSVDDKLNDMFSKMNEKFDAVLKQHEQETKQLKDEIKAKEDEIKRLENVNKAIIMSTNVEKSKDEIDFSSVEFDEVDWNKEASTHMHKIDSKIF